jgi:hypothetical protein
VRPVHTLGRSGDADTLLAPNTLLKTALQNVLRLHLVNSKDNPPKRVLNIHAMLHKPGSSKLRLTKLHVLVDVSTAEKLKEADEWVTGAMKGCFPHRGSC